MLADVMRNSMGSWIFVGGFLLFMAVWAVVNTIAAKHQDAIAAKADIEKLLEINNRQVVMIGELQQALARLDIPGVPVAT